MSESQDAQAGRARQREGTTPGGGREDRASLAWGAWARRLGWVGLLGVGMGAGSMGGAKAVWWAALVGMLVGLELLVSRREAALRQARAEVEQAKRLLSERARERSETVANLSHEIRTPLSAIVGTAEVLQELSTSDRQREMAAVLGKTSAMLLGLVNDVLDFSKLESGQLSFERAPYNPRLLVHEVVTLLQEQARQKKLALSAVIEEGVPKFVAGDPMRVRQVLLNLVSNAVKFTEQGDIVVELSAAMVGGQVRMRCAVRDTGIGLSPELQGQIFRPFQQGDASVSRRYGGTGLGLSISQRLIDLMGGALGVTSQPGQGSTFWFTLDQPLVDAASMQSATQVSTRLLVSEPLRGLRLLVVEDNPINQRVASWQLSRLGCLLDVVGGGQQAIEAVLRTPYDVVLMDCQMPDMDGFEATRRIRALGGDLARLPIIALTASTFEGDRERCLAVGMDDFLGKPFRAEDLVRVVRRNVPPSSAPVSPQPPV